MRRKMQSAGEKISHVIILTILILLAVLCLAPIINIIAVSFSDKASASGGLVTFIPVNFSITPYKYLAQDQRFYLSFMVSVKRILLGGFINLFLTVLMAYPLSKDTHEFKARNKFMWILVFAMMFNGGLIPWYMTIKWTGIYDTIWALVLPGAVPIFNVIILMNFFKGIPKEVCEAASIDGSGPFRILFRIYFPMALPAIATITLFSIVGHWNAFFDGMVLINKEINMPLQTYIRSLVVQPQLSATTVIDSEDLAKLSQRTFDAAKIVVTMVPILIIYPFLQKYFITGINLGAVKE